MANSVAMSGNDSVTLNNRVLSNLGTGDYAKLSFAADIAAVKTGKNGNSTYAYNATGNQAELEIRLIRGTADDQFLLGLLAQQQSNFAGFPLLTGELVKVLGDGQANIAHDTYTCAGGVFLKNPEAMSNAEGNTEQSETVWHIKFSNAPRTIS